jgi:uroporphyrinogen-III synthase
MTQAPQALAGRRLWLTRPVQQNDAVQQALQAHGAQVLSLPLLEIRPIKPSHEHLQYLKDLDRYDFVVFVSSNAARIGIERIFEWWLQYPVGVLNIAVGSGTAAVVREFGLDVRYPTERMDSEGMLALPELSDIAGKKALIVRGVGGREIMGQGLKLRGCSVDYAELYERAMPPHPRDYLAHCLEAFPPEAVVVSSAEALTNLKELFLSVGDEWRELPLFVPSTRLQAHAAELGFAHARRLESASDAAIITGLCAAFAQEGTNV